MTLDYDPPVFRPPSEADSLILQVTVGCSHNRCAFCAMYRGKRFRAKTEEEIRSDIADARAVFGPDVRKAFLADGDAMCLSSRRLRIILDMLNEAFPRLHRVGIYANARDILSKADDELADLREGKLKIVYLGLESGDNLTLEAVQKGATVEEMVTAARRARAAGMATSVMVLVGLAGVERSLEHARLSAEAINAMHPNYTALLTYTPVEGSPLGDAIAHGASTLPSPAESLAEIREFVRAVTTDTYFTCNHASNYLPLVGRLPRAKDDLLAWLDAALTGSIPLKPEFLRGL
jgi:radical SAM superfamily enzyme YgiQ (UPF0313 family)